MANIKRSLTASNIKYLLAIKELGCKEPSVCCAEIAKALSVSKPSVHRMMDTLKEMELVLKDRYGTVSLTEEGGALACIYAEYFEIIQDSLREIFPGKTRVNAAVFSLLSETPLDCLEEICRKISKKKREKGIPAQLMVGNSVFSHMVNLQTQSQNWTLIYQKMVVKSKRRPFYSEWPPLCLIGIIRSRIPHIIDLITRFKPVGLLFFFAENVIVFWKIRQNVAKPNESCYD